MMFKNFLSILLLFISVSLLGQDGRHYCKRADNLNKFYKVHYPGDSRYDVTYYKLDLSLNYNSHNLKGIVTVEGKSTENNLTNIILDLQDVFTVDSTKSGNDLLAFTHSQDQITVTLASVLQTDDAFSVDIFYEGTPGSSGFGSFAFSDHSGQPTIWTLSEPYGASDWWPNKDNPADKADSSDVWITADSFFVSVSNGSLEEIADNGDGTKTYKWKNHYPITPYLISLAMTNYEMITDYFNYSSTDSMIVTHYNYPENINSTRITNLEKTIPMLEVFTEKFGEYPFIMEKYGHAEFGWGGGMEHQTISSMGSYGEGIVSHELAHQWFGDKITCADWHNIWLNEGFATFSEGVFKEAYYSKAAYDSYIISEMGNPGQWWTAKAANGPIYVQDISTTGSIFNSARSYAKGGIVLHMLRGVLGTETFFNVMQTYISHPDLAYGAAVTEDFQEVAENVSGVDLGYFFSQWIYGENYPKYSYGWGYSNISGNTYDVELYISQQTNSNPTFFKMPIQIKVTTALGDSIFTVFNDLQQQTFHFTVEGEPTQLSFDPGNWILKDVTILTGIGEIPGSVGDFVLEQNYPNPFNPSTTIRYNIPEAGEVLIKIYDLLGKEVAALVNERKEPGTYFINFDSQKIGAQLSSGAYIYRMTVNMLNRPGIFTDAKKLLLVK